MIMKQIQQEQDRKKREQNENKIGEQPVKPAPVEEVKQKRVSPRMLTAGQADLVDKEESKSNRMT